MNRKLKKSLKRYDKTKQNKETLISGELGITLGGRRVVEVPARKGFVYVRLKGNTSELIQAYNATVPPVYDLPVFVVRQTGIYKVVGRNIDRHQNQWGSGAYLPKHGAQHSFNHDINVGGDVAWIYSQQFMPLLSYPSGTLGGMTLSVEPHFYEWNGSWRYAQNTGTPDYTPCLPLHTGQARMVLSYIDPADNAIRLVPGTPFSNTITGSAQIAQYIPDIPRSVGIPLAAVRLVTGATSIGWDAIYDVRDFYTNWLSTGTTTGGAGDGIGFVGWDEGVYAATGTVLNVTGAGATMTASGTVLNLNIPGGGGGGGGAGIMGWDEGIPLSTGTVLNVTGAGATMTASGTVLNLNIPGGGGGGAGIMGWDEGIPLATGTVLNVVGSGATLTASGTVLNLSVSTVYPEQVDVSNMFPFTVSGPIREVDTAQMGYFRWHGSPAATDYLEWKVLLQAGTWRIDILAQKNVNKGILTISIDGSSVGTIDLYSAISEVNIPVSVTGISVATTGVKTLKIATPTKNASSSNYHMAFSFITLTKTA